MILVADVQRTKNAKRNLKSNRKYTVNQSRRKGKVFKYTSPLFVNIEKFSVLTKGIERSKKMQKFIRKPSIDMYAGIRVDKDTTLNYENDYVKQTVKDLVFHSVTKIKGENYESVYDTTIHLKEGDVLVFEEEKRGYIFPVDKFVTVAEAIKDYENIKDLG